MPFLRKIQSSLSVAMCTYNGAKYLREQLDSIAFQTRPPDELVVCDDQSSDNTTEIVKTFAAKASFPVHLFVNEENIGSTKNFEKAIRLCEGDIIVLSDQDDVWHPEKLMRMDAVFSNSPRIGAVFTDAEVVDEHLHQLGYRLWQTVWFGRVDQKRIAKDRAFDVMLKHKVVTGATLAFRAVFKELILPIPASWVHDGWIALLISAAVNLAIVHEPLIQYRQHSKNQLGATNKGFKQLLIKTQESDSSDYLIAAEQYSSVYKRLLTLSRGHYRQEVIPKLELKIRHLCARAEMPEEILRWLSWAIKELVTFRYHRYSMGWKSLAQDVLLYIRHRK